jgi:hypothetical protein
MGRRDFFAISLAPLRAPKRDTRQPGGAPGFWPVGLAARYDYKGPLVFSSSWRRQFSTHHGGIPGRTACAPGSTRARPPCPRRRDCQRSGRARESPLLSTAACDQAETATTALTSVDQGTRTAAARFAFFESGGRGFESLRARKHLDYLRIQQRPLRVTSGVTANEIKVISLAGVPVATSHSGACLWPVKRSVLLVRLESFWTRTRACARRGVLL